MRPADWIALDLAEGAGEEVVRAWHRELCGGEPPASHAEALQAVRGRLGPLGHLANPLEAFLPMPPRMDSRERSGERARRYKVGTRHLWQFRTFLFERAWRREYERTHPPPRLPPALLRAWCERLALRLPAPWRLHRCEQEPRGWAVVVTAIHPEARRAG